MQTVIPRSMQKGIARERARLGISESAYVKNAIAHYRHLLALDAGLSRELEVWDAASGHDFGAFAKQPRN